MTKCDTKSHQYLDGKEYRTLLPHHLQDLEKSGITVQTAEEAGIYSEDSPPNIKSIMGTVNKRTGPWLVFPYRDRNGQSVSCSAKQDNPILQRGKVKGKYIQPAGTAARAYFPPGVGRLSDDVGSRLFITEGEKKSLKATQEGFNCIGLRGVENWHKKGRLALCDDLMGIEWKGREVFIAFDSDSATNRAVEDNQQNLANALRLLGAKVRIVRIPEVADNEKAGLDDYLVSMGNSSFEKLVQSAEEPHQLEETDQRQPLTSANLDDAVSELLELEKKQGALRLQHYKGEFYVWSGGVFQKTSPDELKARMVCALKSRYSQVTANKINDVLLHVKAECCLSDRKACPVWIGKPVEDWKPEDIIPFKNGLLHMPSFLEGNPSYSVRPTPALFNRHRVDCEVPTGEEASPANWLEFLNSSVVHQDSIEALQQWFGYCLSPDTSQQKFLFLQGPPRAGKGVICDILRAVVGNDHCASTSLNDLSDSFGLEQLVAKRLAIFADIRLSRRADDRKVLERILSIVGEDEQAVNRKYLPIISEKLQTKLVLCSNELPLIGDSSNALAARALMLPLPNSFVGKEDRELKKRILAELPQIVVWALFGLRSLQKQGEFTQPQTGLELLDELRATSSPVGSFVADCCDVNTSLSIPVKTLYDAHTTWSKEQGLPEVSVNVFGRDLRAAVNSVCRKQRSDGTRYYEGISLKPRLTP